MKILFLANHVNSIILFRMELLQSLLAEGHEVVLSVPDHPEKTGELRQMGIRIIDTAIEPRGMNPIKDLSIFKHYNRIFKEEKPDKVIAYTIKCNVYGGIATRKQCIDFYPNVTGLGYSFIKKGLVQTIVKVLYKMGFKKAKTVFVENPGIKQVLVEAGIVAPHQCHVLNGAGVNLEKFTLEQYPTERETTNFLFIGRIMREKGIDELVQAINSLKGENHSFHVQFVGPVEEEYSVKLKTLSQEGIIECFGFQQDVRPYIKGAHCIILPSWHEGMANVLLEAAASGRPIITSNIHGCMEAVIPNKTGFLFEVRNAKELKKAMKHFLELPYEQKKKMGVWGRTYIEEKFDKRAVVQETINCILQD